MTDPAYDFEFRPGEPTDIAATEEAQQAARRFRDTLGRFATGVTVVTSTYGARPVGITCQSFSSVSLDPPLVMFSPARTSRAWPIMQRSGFFCVNVLADHQRALSEVMASKGADKFAGLSWEPAPRTGSPVFPGVLAWVDCAVHAVHEAGDHYVVVGRVLAMGPEQRPGGAAPLLYVEGDYRTLG